MKKSIFTLMMCAAASGVVAQNTNLPATNAVVISESRNGNTVTTRYRVPHDGKHAEFDVHYALNSADIVPTYSTNPQQMSELKDFMAQSSDTTMHISAIHIVGYASPDGVSTQNNVLAAKRAKALYTYAVNTYHPKLAVDTQSKTFAWADCVSAVQASNIPDKSSVLAVLQSAHTERDKEAKLRTMKDAWHYLTTHILPSMRYADIEFDYGVDEIVTRTTLVAQNDPPKSAETTTTTKSCPPATQQPEVVVVDEEMGIIIATPREDRDSSREERKSQRKSNKNGSQGTYW
ncbi:MAG: hypothetical protein IKV09_03320 [Alistipes sp.]|nr:hypothetical protein [Alistipes sp.]